MTEVRERHRTIAPHWLCRDFLNTDMRAALLAWAIENEAKFESTLVDEGKYDPSRRLSLGVRDFGPAKAEFHKRILDLVPALIRDLRVTPFEPSQVEFELVANNDGAFFERHIDTFVGGARRVPSDRLLSAVYYFYSEPKSFSGGSLRLYPLGAKEDETNFMEVQPEQNTLVVFPSWAPHAVSMVSCPSKLFVDSRFTVNCWVHRTKPEFRKSAECRST